jgi:hypothetical protein
MPEPAAAPSLPDPIRRGPDPAFGPPPPLGRLQPFSPNADSVVRVPEPHTTQTSPPRIHLTAPHRPIHHRLRTRTRPPPQRSRHPTARTVLHGLPLPTKSPPDRPPRPPKRKLNRSAPGTTPLPGTSALRSTVRSLGAFSARLCGSQKPYALIPLLRSPLTGRLPFKTHSGPATPAGKHREPSGRQIPRFVPGPDTNPAGCKTQ